MKVVPGTVAYIDGANLHRGVKTLGWDYAPLIRFWQEKDKMEIILSPALEEKCSVLLKRTDARIAYIHDQKSILEVQNEKAPNED